MPPTLRNTTINGHQASEYADEAWTEAHNSLLSGIPVPEDLEARTDAVLNAMFTKQPDAKKPDGAFSFSLCEAIFSEHLLAGIRAAKEADNGDASEKKPCPAELAGTQSMTEGKPELPGTEIATKGQEVRKKGLSPLSWVSLGVVGVVGSVGVAAMFAPAAIAAPVLGAVGFGPLGPIAGWFSIFSYPTFHAKLLYSFLTN